MVGGFIQKKTGSVAFIAALALAVPASADISATYHRDFDNRAFTIEVAEDGAWRVTQGAGAWITYVLQTGGQIYEVTPGPGGPVATALDAAAELRRRQAAAHGSDEPVSSSVYTAQGSANVAGRAGTLYDLPADRANDFTSVVLSDDSALRPLGQAYAAYSRAVDTLRLSGGGADNLDALLDRHGLLAIGGYELTSLRFEPLDAARFAPPADPLTLAQVLALPEPPPDADPSAPYVVNAVYANDTLYTQLSDQRLQAWPEGAMHPRDVALPGPARALCQHDETLFVATDGGDGTVNLWQGAPGAWVQVADIAETERDSFLGLECSEAVPILLTRGAIWQGGEKHRIRAPSDGFGMPWLLKLHAQGGYLYVGTNAGEWGGGLMRYPLNGGRGEPIDVAAPITGLAADPARPDCILAAAGLVHMVPWGSVQRVCGTEATRIYAKPYTLDPDWVFDPSGDQGALASVAFYSLAPGASGVWAAAEDGIYLFTGGERPDFRPFPRLMQFPQSGLDWSNSDYVLLSTQATRSVSANGGSLILVPR